MWGYTVFYASRLCVIGFYNPKLDKGTQPRTQRNNTSSDNCCHRIITLFYSWHLLTVCELDFIHLVVTRSLAFHHMKRKEQICLGEKSIAMLPARELLPLTGYAHGGCSPVGMKKRFPTVFHESCLEHETICVSAGKVGFQVEVRPADLIALVGASTADLIVEG